LRHGSVRGAIFATVALTAALVCAATVLVTAGHHLLPQQTLDTVHFTRVWFYAAGFISLLSIVALAVLWVRRRTVLDLCLIVVMCAFVIEICMISFPVAARFTVGWYAGRIFGAVSGSLVLLMLLYEITTLYARMLLAVTAQRRERDARLMTGSAISASIAHEVNQPLSAMIFTPLFTTKSHGMGMGLSICRSIIEAHEGKLWATPKRPHGAVFQFVLPAESVRHDG
jgi:signal transduction histidine kinase